MGDVIFKRCCTGTPEGIIRDDKCFLHCPICGKEMYLFPAGVMQDMASPGVRYVPSEIAEAAAKRWNNSLLAKEVENG